jgi:hypothetical protein
MKSPDRRSSPANDVSASVSFPSGVSRATILFERSDFMISVEMQKNAVTPGSFQNRRRIWKQKSHSVFKLSEVS